MTKKTCDFCGIIIGPLPDLSIQGIISVETLAGYQGYWEEYDACIECNIKVFKKLQEIIGKELQPL
jgi:hypothetical protein